MGEIFIRQEGIILKGQGGINIFFYGDDNKNLFIWSRDNNKFRITLCKVQRRILVSSSMVVNTIKSGDVYCIFYIRRGGV